VSMSPPRFLRLDDASRLLVEVNNVSGPAGTYTVELLPGDGLSTDAAKTTIELAEGGRTALSLGVTGTAIGDTALTLLVTHPAAGAMVKELTLGVRAAATEQTVSTRLAIGPGETVSLDSDRFAGLGPHTASLTLAIGPIARLDVPGLLYHL